MLKKQVFSRAVGLALAVVMAFGCKILNSSVQVVFPPLYPSNLRLL